LSPLCSRTELLRFRDLYPEIRIGALVSGGPRRCVMFAEKAGAYAVHARMSMVDKRFVAAAHNRGLKLFVYTVNTGEDLQRMEDMGVDGIFTDYPDLLFDFVLDDCRLSYV
jgi:glycerophosphoryl diester phosphodiesterase